MTPSAALAHSASSIIQPYDPWHDLGERWPGVTIQVVPMTGDLLGQISGDGRIIELRAGTSSGQRRATLAHEIVHLERGRHDCGPWQTREERQVHAMASRRLLRVAELVTAIRALGGSQDLRALAVTLDVDLETLEVRLADLERRERRVMRQALRRQAGLWCVA
ncbi:MAG: hypothetical protein JWN95_1281 [Frankiales bacterium]|nr:hypothetical protein [Frankiales bacterium]